MIGAGEKLNVPVACVEAHRWNPRGYSEMRRMLSDAGVRNLRSDSDFHIMHFASPAMTGGLLGSVSGRVKHYSGRADRFDDVEHLNLFRADQSQVWQNVEKEIEEADVKTPTRTFTEVVVKKEKEGKLEFEVYDSEIGDIFIGGGRVLGMELYETPAMWQNICDQTIKRYKFDFEKDKKFERGLVDKFLSDMAKCGTKAAKSIGLGYDVRLIDGKVEGAGLVVGNANYVPAHFTAMPSLGEGKSDRYPGGGVVRGPYSDISDIFEDMRRRRRGECGPERNPVVGPEWPVVGPEREPVVGGPHDWVYLDSHPPISPGGLIPLRDTRRRRSMRRLDKDLQLLGNIARETSKSD